MSTFEILVFYFAPSVLFVLATIVLRLIEWRLISRPNGKSIGRLKRVKFIIAFSPIIYIVAGFLFSIAIMIARQIIPAYQQDRFFFVPIVSIIFSGMTMGIITFFDYKRSSVRKNSKGGE